jgi:hypothetical protein
MFNDFIAKITPEQRIGAKFGRWTIVGIERRIVGKSRWPHPFAICECDCGNRKTVILGTVVCGKSKSCGCYNREVASKQTKHGLSRQGKRHPMYALWLSMRSRCNNPNMSCYDSYGGRGIFVSARWSQFDVFLADMGERPFKGATVERIDNGKCYAWWNCRWATRAEQCRNQRSNHWVTWHGETLILEDWANRFKIVAATLLGAINRHGEQEAMRRSEQRFKTGKRWAKHV